MPSNQSRYRGNVYHDPSGSLGPLLMLGNFAAGASQAIKRGELLELTGAANTQWVPLDSDFDMSAAAGSGGKIAIAHEEIKSGDRAGYYLIEVPRPGDLWEFDLAAAGATAVGASLYFSDSETVTVTAGTNVIGAAAGQDHYPLKQGHLADDASQDAGTTIRSQSKVIMCIQESNSYFSAFAQP